MPTISTSSHSFSPIKPWDKWHDKGRCRHCYLPKFQHPVTGWVRARPLGDKSAAVPHNVIVSTIFLNGKRIADSIAEAKQHGRSER